MKIFVYGTLLQGMEREKVLENSLYLGPTIIRANLFDLGYFPGIKPGEGAVVGELYEIDEETLKILDEIEGYYEKNEKDSLFIRQETVARKFSNGEYLKVLTYFYNSPVTRNQIRHGDYRRYILERNNEYQWILAYGSNISLKRITERVGKIDDYEKVYINGFKLVFNKKSYWEDSVYANICYTGSNEKCPAIAYRLSPKQITILDQYEGTPSHYMRITLPFLDEFGYKNIAQTYIAHPDQLTSKKRPDPNYLQHIKNGYKEHGFEIKNF